MKKLIESIKSYLESQEEIHTFSSIIYTKMKLFFYMILIFCKNSYIAKYRISVDWEQTESQSIFKNVEESDYEILNWSTRKIKISKIKKFLEYFHGAHIELMYNLAKSKTERYKDLAYSEEIEWSKISLPKEKMYKVGMSLDELVVFFITAIIINEKELRYPTH